MSRFMISSLGNSLRAVATVGVALRGLHAFKPNAAASDF
jgi:hypothetical protein